MPEELWTEVHMNIVQVAVITATFFFFFIKTTTKKCKKAKCLSDESLQIAEKRKDAKAKEKKKEIPI